ncbi:MAG TPA: cupin domain-containing protein [Verrucomicrobiae bacterium]|nr:cupin domain-containing protein [Verrucomicrobiae bacterium]
MNVKRMEGAKEWFSVLQTSRNTQTAVMTLKPGQSSGEEAEAHEKSEQVLVVISGEVFAEVEAETKLLSRGDVILIPPGTRHKFTNRGPADCVTFNTYSPPEY